MTRLSEARIRAFRQRFPDREDLSPDELFEREFSREELPKSEVLEILRLIAEELALPLGLLRPGDVMEHLLEPLHTGNPLRWIEEWTRAADGKAEINYRLSQRLKELGTLEAWPTMRTVGDVARAWSGRSPAHQ